MLKRLATLIGAGLLALGLSGSAAAHTTGTYHYNAACSSSTDGTDNYNPHAAVTRPTSGSASYKAIRSTVIQVLPLHPCWVDGSPHQGFSMVFAVNFFGSTGSVGASGQMGYAVQACNPGGCVGGQGDGCRNVGFSNQVIDFAYTSVDNNLNIQRACWVDFNSDGIHDTPQIGKSYTFEIDWTSGSSWLYCITDNNGDFAGLLSCHYVPKHANTGYMANASYFFETYNDASAFGSFAADGSTAIDLMQYKNYNGSIFSTVVNTSSTCGWVVYGPWPAPTHWASEVCSEDNTGPNATGVIRAYQAWHN